MQPAAGHACFDLLRLGPSALVYFCVSYVFSLFGAPSFFGLFVERRGRRDGVRRDGCKLLLRQAPWRERGYVDAVAFSAGLLSRCRCESTVIGHKTRTSFGTGTRSLGESVACRRLEGFY